MKAKILSISMHQKNIDPWEMVARISTMVVGLDRQNNIVYINESATLFNNWGKEDVLGENYVDLCNRTGMECPDLLKSDDKAALESGEGALCKVRSTDGKERFAKWYLFRQEKFRQNADLCRWLIGEDCTLEISLMREVAVHKRLCKAVMDTMAGGYWVKDKDGCFTAVNEEFVRCTGFTDCGDILGKTDYDMPWAEMADALIKNDKEVMASGRATLYKEHVKFDPDGIQTVLVKKFPLRDFENNMIGTIGFSYARWLPVQEEQENVAAESSPSPQPRREVLCRGM